MPISDEDRKKIEELRGLVKEHLTPYYDTDYNLLRWLKGHDYNLDVIKPKLINHLIMRKGIWDLDNLPDKPRDHAVHQHWKCGITGEAKRTPNCIVNIEQTGGNDYWGMTNVHPINEIMKARLHDLESMLRAVMEMEKRTGEQCAVLYVMDLTGLKMDRRLMSLITGGLASISAFMAEHYVEMVHSFVLVNVPSFISAIWTVARPLLPEKTRNKVNILGSNWKQDILDLVDPACLPSYWNEDDLDGPFLAPVERGVEYSPDEYYKEPVPEKAQVIHIPAGKSGYVDVEAKEVT
ncbi:CRAL/TRIO domain protein [Oesophagostomum dentatum]|uniref:CRAL/TRIO domain protein n=1 Tax=Oesophagostomum dentatum TaxID=61180 RepID=A0A0B1RUE4_OESDE|nr:CRAL/TRIO domain protein [Oesophagostomum dentatum]